VERHYSQQGALLPAFHKAYWLGLSAGPQWPDFVWVDGDIPSTGDLAWSRWGPRSPDMVAPYSRNCSGEQPVGPSQLRSAAQRSLPAACCPLLSRTGGAPRPAPQSAAAPPGPLPACAERPCGARRMPCHDSPKPPCSSRQLQLALLPETRLDKPWRAGRSRQRLAH
jgi:hypothetical protein